MSIDERVAELKGKHDMLTERHNALVESIELWIMENREMYVKWNERCSGLDARIDKLLQVAQLHEHRLNSHDERLDELEGSA